MRPSWQVIRLIDAHDCFDGLVARGKEMGNTKSIINLGLMFEMVSAAP